VPPTGFITNSDDCKDNDPNINPLANDDTCDSVDNDCDGEVDEDVPETCP
jgi:hypothetical protein